MSSPFLVGERLYLRSLEQSDLTDNYLGWLNNDEVCAGNSHAIFPQSHESLLAYFESVSIAKNKVVLAIICSEQDKHIGNISLQSIDSVNRTAELAILLGDKEYWGKGYGFEASRLIVKYGFERLNLNRIYCGTFDSNQGMKRLAEKLGMKNEGCRRQAVFKSNQYIDIIEYGLLKTEYLAK